MEVLHLAGAFMEYFLEGRALLRLWQVNSEEEIFYLVLFPFRLMYQCLNGAIPSRKCSIKAPAKWRNSVYVLTEICHQRIKWLGAKIFIYYWQKHTCIWLWYCFTFSISIAVVFGVITDVFGVIVSNDTFLVKADLKRLLFGFEEEEAIFELIRGDFLIWFWFDIFF